jgi:hypothetical protein
MKLALDRASCADGFYGRLTTTGRRKQSQEVIVTDETADRRDASCGPASVEPAEKQIARGDACESCR